LLADCGPCEAEPVIVDRRGANPEYQEAERLSQAAGVIASEPGTLTLRTLQTLAEVATEHNSTLVLPIPIDILDAVRQRVGSGA
jgi:hypothetical protein